MENSYQVSKIISRFSVKNLQHGYQTTYRIIQDEEGFYRIEDYLSNIRKWTNTYSPTFRWTNLDTLWHSVEFKNLFINNI